VIGRFGLTTALSMPREAAESVRPLIGVDPALLAGAPRPILTNPGLSKRGSVYPPVGVSGHVTNRNIAKRGGLGEHVVPRRISRPQRRSTVTCSSRLMTVESLGQHLYEFAAEFHRLAFWR
jgi:hypothetical protein